MKKAKSMTLLQRIFEVEEDELKAEFENIAIQIECEMAYYD